MLIILLRNRGTSLLKRFALEGMNRYQNAQLLIYWNNGDGRSNFIRSLQCWYVTSPSAVLVMLCFPFACSLSGPSGIRNQP